MKAGRNRSFDIDIALSNAMEVFWKNGYSGTSLTDLTKAMGINKPSLYSAYGNKEKLFNSALELYLQKHGLVHTKELQASDKPLNERVYCYLVSIAKMVTTSKLPKGCFVAGSTSDLSEEDLPASVLEAVCQINKKTKLSLIEFFQEEKSQGNLSPDQSPKMLADYLLMQQFGLAAMGKNKAKLNDLEPIIKHIASQF